MFKYKKAENKWDLQAKNKLEEHIYKDLDYQGDKFQHYNCDKWQNQNSVCLGLQCNVTL